MELTPVPIRHDIHGWFDWHKLYTRFARTYPNGSHFVEVGSWLGKSACYLAESVKAFGKQIRIDCVDIWDDNSVIHEYQDQIIKAHSNNMTLQKAFEANLLRYGVLDMVNPVKGESVAVAKTYKDQSLQMVFIDAGHDYESVCADLEAWYPKVALNCTIAGHDYHYSQGVYYAVKEYFKDTHEVFGQCWVCKRKK